MKVKLTVKYIDWNIFKFVQLFDKFTIGNIIIIIYYNSSIFFKVKLYWNNIPDDETGKIIIIIKKISAIAIKTSNIRAFKSN